MGDWHNPQVQTDLQGHDSSEQKENTQECGRSRPKNNTGDTSHFVLGKLVKGKIIHGLQLAWKMQLPGDVFNTKISY